jgi:hypothetical protein
MAMLACRIQPPLQHVPGDHERSGNGAIATDLRITANVDQRRSAVHRRAGLRGMQPAQPLARRCQQLIDRCPRHPSVVPGPAARYPTLPRGIRLEGPLVRAVPSPHSQTG